MQGRDTTLANIDAFKQVKRGVELPNAVHAE
jgi:hypothetical protein